MSGIISTTITNGVMLSVSPTTITATGLVESSTAYAVANGGAAAYTLVNYGRVIGSPEYAGVYLGQGGEVVNAAAATISGSTGVTISGVGSVLNAGDIASTGRYYGVWVQSGIVSNTSGGVIAGYDAGIDLDGSQGAATVINSGVITAANTFFGAGVLATYGGTLVNNLGGTIASRIGVRGVTSLNNAGVILGTSGYAALVAGQDGVLSNAVSGVIDGYTAGMASAAVAFYSAGIVLNAGTIELTSTTGYSSTIFVYGNGYVSNASSGLILSDTAQAINLEQGISTVINAGRIEAPKSLGVDLNFGGGGTVDNLAGGMISAYLEGIYAASSAVVVNRGNVVSQTSFGVALQGGGTLINAGTITSSIGNAVYLQGSAGNLVVLDPGAAFGGIVQGGTVPGTNILELAAGTGVFTTGFEDFGTVTFDPGAAWLVGGDTAALASGQLITGFAAGDTIELQNFVATSQSVGSGGLVLGSAGLSETIDIAGGFTINDFNVVASGFNTSISLVPCFRAGTALLTERGMVAVENLEVGDRAAVLGGGFRPVVWLGHRRVDCRRHPTPPLVWPVRVATGALGRNCPSRDLFLSPDHAVFLAGGLIPIKQLINGCSIAQVQVDEVEYWHVELDGHDVLLAEGVAAESFLDSGNRAQFANGGPVVMAHADFARAAPLVLSGPALARARRQVYRHTRTTQDQTVLIADTQVIRPASMRGGWLSFVVPPCRTLQLLPDAAVGGVVLGGRRFASLAALPQRRAWAVLEVRCGLPSSATARPATRS